MGKRGLEKLTERERKRRAASGKRALKGFAVEQGVAFHDRTEVLTDLLSNLMHYWADHFAKHPGDLPFTTIYQRAVDHNQLELGFEQEYDSFPGATNQGPDDRNPYVHIAHPNPRCPACEWQRGESVGAGDAVTLRPKDVVRIVKTGKTGVVNRVEHCSEDIYNINLFRKGEHIGVWYSSTELKRIGRVP